jgi:hypothetical protein
MNSFNSRIRINSTAAENGQTNANQAEALKDMGTIEVRMLYVHVTNAAHSPTLLANPPTHDNAVPEKAMKGRAVTHNVK